MVEGQVAAYMMEHHKTPSMDELIDGEYLPDAAKCPDGTEVTIEDGKVTADKKSDQS